MQSQIFIFAPRSAVPADSQEKNGAGKEAEP